jgi:sulfatase maturation enzyme AslB (radical SAM superfamily)
MTIVWRVTEQCNLGCQFCAYSREINRARTGANPGHIREFGEILGQFRAQTGDEILVSWLGGEPFLWPPLAELTRQFHQAGLQLSATTNGTTLHAPEVRRHLVEFYSELTISLDGLGWVHDRVRNWPGGFAQLERAITQLAHERRSAKQGPRLRINTILMRDNVAELEQFCLTVAAWGIDEITFNQLGGNDRPAFYPANRLLPQQVAALAADLPRIRTRLAAGGVRLLGGPRYLQRINASSTNSYLAIDDCQPGTRFLFISEAGKIAPCSFTSGDYGIDICQITSVSALRQLPARFAARRHSQRSPVCRDCPSTQVFDKFLAA